MFGVKAQKLDGNYADMWKNRTLPIRLDLYPEKKRDRPAAEMRPKGFSFIYHGRFT